jgi:hypothetical protein
MSYYTNGNTASEMIARADANYEWQERREWERAHLPPPGDGVKDEQEPAQDEQKHE